MQNDLKKSAGEAGPRVQIHLCVPDDQKRHVPRRRRVPDQLPHGAPIPRLGEVIYLAPTSAWGVQMVIHEWQDHATLRVEVWLEYVNSSRGARPSGFSLTQ